MIKIHHLENFIEFYLEEKDINVSTKAVYQGVLKQYKRYLCENNILFAASNDINDYIDDDLI